MACLVALFVVLVVFVVSRLAIYGRRLAFLQSFEVDRQRFVASPGPSLHNEPSLVQGLQERVPDVKRLLDEARVPHPTFFYTEPVGYNRIRSGAAPSLDNVQHQTDADVIETTNVAVRQAIGFYGARVRETLSPLFWIEFAVFFPKHVAKYLGLEGDSVATKIATAAWAVLAPVLTYVLALHKATIDAALTDWTRGLVERVFGS